ncbi:MAG: ABC transporter ATP-binding protein [Eubacteriales bacterium]|nr:ABC transporter ATP-binding protein [Eubacteriales bacterium]
MIDLQHVSKSYNGKIQAVDHIDLSVQRGEIFGFLGPNGAGKTTTIKMITGILEPDTGSILVNGHDIVKDPIRAKRSFGFVPDDPNVFPRLKAIEYLRFIGEIYEVEPAVRRQRISQLADRLGLSSALGDRIQSFSHGMRQKLIIIGALLHQPAVWILDEPMTGLDPKAAFELKEMMREHAAAGNTVFFSTHVLDVAEKICDRVAIIDHGKILLCGTLADLRARTTEDASLEAMFLRLVEQESEHTVPTPSEPAARKPRFPWGKLK